MTPLRQLNKFRDILVCTREEHRRSRHYSRRAPVLPPHPKRSFRFHASPGRESRHSRRTSRGSGLHLMLERNSRGCATISNTHNVPVHCRHTGLPCTDSMVTPRTDSKHDGRCDSPLALREKAPDSYRQPDRKTITAFPGRKESRLAWLTRDQALTCLWMPQRNLDIHVCPGPET